MHLLIMSHCISPERREGKCILSIYQRLNIYVNRKSMKYILIMSKRRTFYFCLKFHVPYSRKIHAPTRQSYN